MTLLDVAEDLPHLHNTEEVKIEDPTEEDASADLEPGPALRVGALDLPAAAPSLVIRHAGPQL